MSDHPVALVTGGGSGLGAGLCRHLARSGWNVAIHYHSSRASAEGVLREVASTGREAMLLQADLGREPDVLRLVADFSSRFGHLELLINNAGVYHAKAFGDLTEAEWFSEFNSTATAVYFTTRACLPLLRASRGRIINIGDGACDRPGARSMAPAYHIGKTGVYILTRSFAQAEAPHGVAVNLLSPGLLETSVGLGHPQEVPAGRFGTFEDLFAAVDFLTNVDTPYLTGSHLIAGGGWNL
ncbi:MAG: SDR family NAD(P)-dependent oxidoreductase [Verrucomicrobia bacterium]|nr:SDR family NAD(P)-dependent oxidoreductase [Verrucomicrobiota bacterium]